MQQEIAPIRNPNQGMELVIKAEPRSLAQTFWECKMPRTVPLLVANINFLIWVFKNHNNITFS